jgi:peptidoglycan/xylan/chitin deacetylase (PgdA/CDA1 family)
VPKRPDSQAWRYWRTVAGVVAAGAVLVIGGLTGHVTRADSLSCAVVKCVALTFDDGPGPFDERLLQILKDNDAKATFFLIGNKVAANPAGAKRIADAGMEIGSHTWEHPNMATIPTDDIAAQFSKANRAYAHAVPTRRRLVHRNGAADRSPVWAGRNPLGCNPFRLGERFEHGGDAVHADDIHQARLGGAVP